jgi:hypothetical protein
MQRQARTSGNDPTASITAAAGAKSALLTAEEPQEATKESGANDDLKKLIETLKNKLNSNGGAQQKSAPPAPKTKTVWNRSIAEKDRTFNPAYTVLTRISNHEKVPVKSTRSIEITSKSLPDSFIFRPGADGIQIDKLSVKAGKQLGTG